MTVNNVPCAATPSNVDAYWCPYEPNACKSIFLSDDAFTMFTAEMDGCTCAVGSQVPGGVDVAHANLGGKGNEQIDLVKPTPEFKNDKGVRYLGPASYRYSLPAGIVTWKFFSQVVMIDKSAKTRHWSRSKRSRAHDGVPSRLGNPGAAQSLAERIDHAGNLVGVVHIDLQVRAGARNRERRQDRQQRLC